MINKLHLAMIELYRGDAKRIQHFCKVHRLCKIDDQREITKSYRQLMATAGCFSDCGFIDMINRDEQNTLIQKQDVAVSFHKV